MRTQSRVRVAFDQPIGPAWVPPPETHGRGDDLGFRRQQQSSQPSGRPCWALALARTRARDATQVAPLGRRPRAGCHPTRRSHPGMSAVPSSPNGAARAPVDPVAVAGRDRDPITIRQIMARSGLFPDITRVCQAVVKILAGGELRIGPFAAMSDIHLIDGKPVVGAGSLPPERHAAARAGRQGPDHGAPRARPHRRRHVAGPTPEGAAEHGERRALVSSPAKGLPGGSGSQSAVAWPVTGGSTGDSPSGAVELHRRGGHTRRPLLWSPEL